MRILLVEDDSLLGEGLLSGLQRENNSVDWVKNGESALTSITNTDYDAIILDIGLPKMSGIDVLKQSRQQGYTLPILILTARDSISDKITGLDAGADDYLIKPFEFEELCARLRALTRRSNSITVKKISYKNIEIDTAAYNVMYNNEPVKVSRREFSLLEELLSNTGRVFSRAQLEDKLYSWGDEIGSNAIEVHIHHLRKQFGNDLIKTVRGVGYIVPKE